MRFLRFAALLSTFTLWLPAASHRTGSKTAPSGNSTADQADSRPTSRKATRPKARPSPTRASPAKSAARVRRVTKPKRPTAQALERKAPSEATPPTSASARVGVAQQARMKSRVPAAATADKPPPAPRALPLDKKPEPASVVAQDDEPRLTEQGLVHRLDDGWHARATMGYADLPDSVPARHEPSVMGRLQPTFAIEHKF